MGKLDLNLDAYRFVAELLHRLRTSLRQRLEELAGEAWEECIPEDLRLFLSQRRQREQGVAWFRTDSCDLLDYASFSDLAEILAANPTLLEGADWLPPTGREAMLRVRFLELDTVFQRVAYARPVSELEMELLATLGERIRKTFAGGEATHLSRPTPRQESPVATPKTSPPAPPTPQPTPTPPRSKPQAEAGATAETFHRALEAGETKKIMAALYREVVTTADAIFKNGRPSACPVWELVRESPWYEQNFRKLSLAPLSHFYDIVDDTKELARSGNREEILEALRNRGFAQTLLQLKELFQPFLT
ncbi:MAG: hypothetical protein ACP5NF_02595 [Thermoanaerobaculum sp.]